jgi:hypothetical protein
LVEPSGIQECWARYYQSDVKETSVSWSVVVYYVLRSRDSPIIEPELSMLQRSFRRKRQCV